jgi:hypothetical protein
MEWMREGKLTVETKVAGVDDGDGIVLLGETVDLRECSSEVGDA